jgi:hypothetical protein
MWYAGFFLPTEWHGNMWTLYRTYKGFSVPVDVYLILVLLAA